MPTGYTAELHDGKDITFEEFVLACARNFGALILMRDDPKDAPIPTFEARTVYQEQMKAEAERDLAVLRAMTDEEKRKAHAAATAEAERQIADDVQKAQAIRDRYEAMLRQVEAWEPPTKDHQGLKDFMVQQLNESIRFDCTDAGKWRSLPEEDVNLWWQQQVWAKERTIARALTDIAAEIERTQERNKCAPILVGRTALNPARCSRVTVELDHVEPVDESPAAAVAGGSRREKAGGSPMSDQGRAGDGRMRLDVCQGYRALGRCDKRSVYFVGGIPSCGIHLAHTVKRVLDRQEKVAVVRRQP